MPFHNYCESIFVYIYDYAKGRSNHNFAMGYSTTDFIRGGYTYGWCSGWGLGSDREDYNPGLYSKHYGENQ